MVAECAFALRRMIKPRLFRATTSWHRHRKDDDDMMRASRQPMTIAQLKRHMDRRFDRLERTKADKSEIRRLREEIARSAEETRRHFDIVAESLRDDFRIFADSIGRQTERLNQHETRIIRLEERSL